MSPADNEKSLAALYALLAGLTDRQLQQVIRSLVAQRPELLDVVRQEAARLRTQPAAAGGGPATTSIPVDTASITREIHKDFQSAVFRDHDRYDWDEGAFVEASQILQPHLEKVNLLLEAGNPAAAAAVLATVIDQWVIETGALEDWLLEGSEDSLFAAEQKLGVLLAETLLSQELAASERREWLKRIRKWKRDEINLEVAVGALEQGWDYAPLVAVLSGQDAEWQEWEGEFPESAAQLVLARLRVLDRHGRITEYLNLARAAGQVGLYLNRLALMGATEQAVADAQRLLISPADALPLAKILDEQGQLAAAEAVAEHGMTLSPYAGVAQSITSSWDRTIWIEYAARPLVELARWTVELAVRRRNPQLALRAALLAFAWTCEVEDYQLVQLHAGDQWPILREDLLESVRDAKPERQLEIYLYERMATEAKAVVDSGLDWSLVKLLSQVLALTGADYPDWSIAHAKKRAESIMEAGKSGAYEDAVAWLRQARTIYLQHNRRQEWEEYLAALRSRYARKYKLIGLMREFN